MENWKQCVERAFIIGGMMVLVFLLVNLWFLAGGGEESVSLGVNTNLHNDSGENAGKDMSEQETESESVNEDVKPKIALTFDDGPHPVYTPMILDGLKERGVKATFFVLGKNIVGREDVIKRMSEEGHLIGNHTYSHVNLNTISPEKACGELVKTCELVKEITGKETDYVRPPFGLWNPKAECRVDMMTVLWNIDPRDWNSTDTGQIVKKVVTKAKENAIILLHDYYQTSVDAALEIVDQLQSKGYRFVTVEDILMD